MQELLDLFCYAAVLVGAPFGLGATSQNSRPQQLLRARAKHEPHQQACCLMTLMKAQKAYQMALAPLDKELVHSSC